MVWLLSETSRVMADTFPSKCPTDKKDSSEDQQDSQSYRRLVHGCVTTTVKAKANVR